MATISGQEFLKGGKPRVVGNETQIIKDEAQNGPSLFQRLSESVKQTGTTLKDIVTGEGGFAGQTAPRRGAELAREAITAPIKVATAALPEEVVEPIQKVGEAYAKGRDFMAELVNKVPGFTDFVNQNPQAAKAIEEIAGFTGAAAETGAVIAGGVPTIKTIGTGAQKAIAGAKEAQTGISEILSKANRYTPEIKDKITDAITKIDPKTKNILETTSIEKFDRYVKQGEKALKDPREFTPLEQAGERANTLLGNIKEDMGRIGSQKQKTLESVGSVRVPKSASEEVLYLRDTTRKMRLTKDERSLVEQYIKNLEELGKNPSAQSLDKTVDLLQATLFERKGGVSIPVTSRVQGLINASIGRINQKLKNAVDAKVGADDYSKLNAEYARRRELFDELNQKLGEDAGKGGSLLKRFFSPQDSGTKKLFAEIKEIYGVDLAEDAVLAKFVMDSLGDVRSRSLLDIPKSKGGLIERGIEAVEQKFTQPIEKARRVIEKRTPQKKQR